MTRHYYAEYCPWGTNTISRDDELYRFDSRAARDEFVESCNANSDGIDVPFCVDAVTLAGYVRRRYDVSLFSRDLGGWRDFYVHVDEDGNEYIHQRPGYCL